MLKDLDIKNYVKGKKSNYLRALRRTGNGQDNTIDPPPLNAEEQRVDKIFGGFSLDLFSYSEKGFDLSQVDFFKIYLLQLMLDSVSKNIGYF